MLLYYCFYWMSNIILKLRTLIKKLLIDILTVYSGYDLIAAAVVKAVRLRTKGYVFISHFPCPLFKISHQSFGYSLPAESFLAGNKADYKAVLILRPSQHAGQDFAVLHSIYQGLQAVPEPTLPCRIAVELGILAA